MALNSGALNTKALNASVDGVVVIGSGEGTLLNIEQEVVIIGSGTLLNLEQEVELRTTGEGTLLSVVQYVTNSGEGTLLGIQQQVLSLDTTMPAPSPSAGTAPILTPKGFFDRNGFDCLITLGGLSIHRQQIHGTVQVDHYEDDSASAEFTIIPGAGTYDMFSYQGKDVGIYVRTGPSFVKIFTGKVDIPSVNLIEEKITLKCVADREKLINNNLITAVGSFGYFSPTVSGTPKNVFEEVEARLETIPYSLDFDGNNNWHLTSWTPKATADFVYGSSDVYYSEPKVIIESGKKVVNKININFEYNYQRLHQRQLTYQFVYGGKIKSTNIDQSPMSFCPRFEHVLSFPTRNMIQSAAEAAGWVVSSMEFQDLWRSGFYNCGIVTYGWSTSTSTYESSPTGQTDKDGNAVYEPILTRVEDFGSGLCRNASWRATKRFSQNIKEKYSLTVQSVQSQLIYGIVEEDLSYSLQADFDSSQWEDEATYRSQPAGTKIGSGTNYYINKDINQDEFNQAAQAALSKARTRLYEQHRDSRIVFDRFITPSIGLQHTVQLTGKWVQGKGKVRHISHTFDPEGNAKTHIELAIFRATGTASQSSLVAPTRPTDVVPSTPTNISLGARWGFDPSSAEAAKWTGYIGNGAVTEVLQERAPSGSGRLRVINTYMTEYPMSFVVDTPAIPDDLRGDRELLGSQSYSISVPNNDVDVIFYWSKS